MKPSRLLPIAIMCFALGCAWTCHMLYGASWYAEHIHSSFIMGIFITAALLMLFGGFVFILSRFE